MRPSLDILPSSPLHQPASINRRPTHTNESYQAQSKGVSIALTTKEGDTITFSQQSANSQYRKESTAIGSSHFTEQTIRLDGMELSVQGDLNQQELDDLSRLFDDLSAIANDFFNGNMGDALTGAMNIGDMGSISQLDATFTRTSILSRYLEGSHPLPSLNKDSNTLLAEGPFRRDPSNNSARAPEPRIIDIMTAQWQQFLNAIKPNQSRTYPPKHPSPVSQHLAAKNMLERTKETMSTHPRLTPLLPSVADLAIEQTANQYHPREAATLLAKSTSTAFNSLFSNWVL